jgi:hypothetical protein
LRTFDVINCRGPGCGGLIAFETGIQDSLMFLMNALIVVYAILKAKLFLGQAAARHVIAITSMSMWSRILLCAPVRSRRCWRTLNFTAR